MLDNDIVSNRYGLEVPADESEKADTPVRERTASDGPNDIVAIDDNL